MPAVRLLLVLLCFCAPASAELVPSPTPSAAVGQPGWQPGPAPAFEHLQAEMERSGAQLRASQFTLRRTVLGMLSPAQREFVATLIGQLAIAPDPDVMAATQRIDAALSPAQREAVLRLVAAEATRREAMFRHMVAQSQREMAALEPPALAPQVPSAGSPRSSSVTMQVGSGIAMSGPGMLLGSAPGQSAGATLLSLLTSSAGSPFWPRPVLMRSTLAPASGSGP